MLRSILLAAFLVIGFAAQATAASVCEESPNGNPHLANWCDTHGDRR